MDPVPGAMPNTGRPDRQGPLPGQGRWHQSRDAGQGASAFFNEWEIEDEPGEVAIVLEGDAGLVPTP